MSQFLDCFSQEDIIELLKKAKSAINKNGAGILGNIYGTINEPMPDAIA